jgi:hypothetical protein
MSRHSVPVREVAVAAAWCWLRRAAFADQARAIFPAHFSRLRRLQRGRQCGSVRAVNVPAVAGTCGDCCGASSTQRPGCRSSGVEHSLGKGEVKSSNLFGSTTFALTPEFASLIGSAGTALAPAPVGALGSKFKETRLGSTIRSPRGDHGFMQTDVAVVLQRVISGLCFPSQSDTGSAAGAFCERVGPDASSRMPMPRQDKT